MAMIDWFIVLRPPPPPLSSELVHARHVKCEIGGRLIRIDVYGVLQQNYSYHSLLLHLRGNLMMHSKIPLGYRGH